MSIQESETLHHFDENHGITDINAQQLIAHVRREGGAEISCINVGLYTDDVQFLVYLSDRRLYIGSEVRV